MDTLSPSGRQHEISGGGYRAVVTESGGALRLLEHDGVALLDGFGEHEMSPGGRGQLLMPWPNRVRDGRYEHEGRAYQLPLTEPARHNASHGLARWTAWTPAVHEADRAVLTYRVMAQTGYPWTLDLEVEYVVDADGLRVTQRATNRAATAAPFASGAHPYLRVGAGPVDGWHLTVPAARRYLLDDRLNVVGSEAVDGTAYDLRGGGALGDLALNDTFTDLERDAEGRAHVHLTGPEAALTLWLDAVHACVLLYTADDVAATTRRSVAVEPMTAPPNAFATGDGLRVLAPGETFAGSWGLRRVSR